MASTEMAKEREKINTEGNRSHEKRSHLHSLVQDKIAEVKEGGSRKVHNKTPAMMLNGPNDRTCLAEAVCVLMSVKNKGWIHP